MQVIFFLDAPEQTIFFLDAPDFRDTLDVPEPIRA